VHARGGRVAKTGPFTRDLFQFLRELNQNNNRDWFQRNKDRYETSVRDPVLRFIVDVGPRLKELSPHFVADASPIGGSMMRIYRDLRFSKDKRPYKTAIGVHFLHAQGKDGATPAFYLHLAPDDSSVGAGIWRPEPRALKRIRDAIAEDPKKWERATSGRKFQSIFTMVGESLKRPPSGYDPNHPFIKDIKRKDFAAGSPLSAGQVYSLDFMEVLFEALRAATPFAKFLTQAVGLPF
jgi:uncharacterized protein (TIGR02453 family)